MSRGRWFLCLFLGCAWALPADAKMRVLAKDPYVGALVIDAGTGEVLYEDQADALCYPASVLKLMDLLIVLEKIEQGAVRAEDPVLVTAEASRIGGSQVFLAEKETFTVDELLYALAVQSANDAATALAIHLGGSKDGFVALMNQRAKELGLKSTRFHSVHGLPPAKDQQPDISTARDLARLGLELLKHPDALRYTSTKEKGFRGDQFIMRNHNNLLRTFPGCDGFKTGYFSAAGFSIVATAARNDRRLVAVVVGSTSKQVRDAKAAELLSQGFLKAPAKKEADAAPPAAAPGL